MTEKKLRNIVFDYSQMSEDSLIELKNLAEKCPYCQTAQILYLLNLKRLGEKAFDTRLPHTAICVNDRKKLKQSVGQVEKILMKEKLGVKYPQSSPQTSYLATPQSFRGKTISELLSFKKSEPAPQNNDDKFLETLRMEAFAKIHERLTEAHNIMARSNFLENPSRKKVTKEIIDNVIATSPKISKIDDSLDAKLKKSSHWKLKEEHSLRENFELVSETLAQLYIAQGAHTKAREIYKTLSKIHPEKADYFKQLGKEIKPNQKSKIKNLP
ncbi:MAG: hypothetical protein FWC94_04315 [Bacteroidales bacterium]|nr:hypothetical protein [Bacteroidales bacterium]